MKKKFISKIAALLLVMIFCCSYSLTASAYYIETNAHYAPGGTTNSWVSSADTSKMTASSSPVTPDNVYFYYKSDTLRSLPEKFVASSDRKIQIYLMEKDTISDDDYAKYYEGTFNGRYIKEIKYKNVMSNDDLEVGRSVELYIKQYVTRVTGDTQTTYTSLFSYYCGID